MEKITDNEIIKALDCCSKMNCRGCVFWEMHSAQCVSELLSNTLDFINRQKAEIERLRKENKILSANADTAFQDGLNENRDLFKKEVEHEIKSEAIKEFVKRANGKLSCYIDQCGESVPYVMADIIDNLVKEMTEDGK